MEHSPKAVGQRLECGPLVAGARQQGSGLLQRAGYLIAAMKRFVLEQIRSHQLEKLRLHVQDERRPGSSRVGGFRLAAQRCPEGLQLFVF